MNDRTRQEASTGDLILEIKRLREEYGQLRDESYEKIDKLQQQLKKANSEIKDLYSGRLGACHTCEQVAELNIKLEQQLKEANDLLDAYNEMIKHDYNSAKVFGTTIDEYLNKYKVKE